MQKLLCSIFWTLATYSHVAQGEMVQRRRQEKNKSLKQILSTSYKIPVNCDADFNTIFIFIKVKVYKTQNNSRWSRLVLKVINVFRQAINAVLTLMFAHSQMFSKVDRVCSILVFLLAFMEKCVSWFSNIWLLNICKYLSWIYHMEEKYSWY